MYGAIPPLPQYAFMAWCSVKKNTGTTLPLVTIYMSIVEQNGPRGGLGEEIIAEVYADTSLDFLDNLLIVPKIVVALFRYTDTGVSLQTCHSNKH
jgi:hypothetical protein